MRLLWIENKIIIKIGASDKFSNPSVITIAINVEVY
jgi:hypothetical protein